MDPSVFALVRNAAELGVGDVVLTPSLRRAEVIGHLGGRVMLVYLDDHGLRLPDDRVNLFAHWLHLVRKAGQPLAAALDAARAGL